MPDVAESSEGKVEMKVYAVVMRKGGTGKTTTAAHLAAGLADKGRRVLIIDLDPQSQQADLFGVPVEAGRSSREVLLEERPLVECMYDTRNLKLVPASRHWENADVVMSGLNTGRVRLRLALKTMVESVPADALPEVVVIDTPPNLGALTANAIIAATDVLIPVEASQGALMKLPETLETIRELKEGGLAPNVRIVGLLPTRVNLQTGHGVAVVEALRANPEQLRVFKPIHERVRLKECFVRHTVSYDFDRDASGPYQDLVEALA